MAQGRVSLDGVGAERALPYSSQPHSRLLVDADRRYLSVKGDVGR